MKLRVATSACFAVLVLCRVASASDPVGIYAFVERVVLEPNDKNPQRVQVWGVFALADRGNREYKAPKRGYMYFDAVPDKVELCRREWSDLKKVARGADLVALGHRYQPLGRVREAGEKAAEPDRYPMDNGVVKLRPDPSRNLSIGSLVDAMLQLPVPQTPADGAAVAAGPVKLVSRGVADRKHADAKYVFEIEGRDGAKEESDPIALADKLAQWTPKMQIKPGETYAWRVWATDGQWKSPVADSTFRGKDAP